MMFVTEFVLFIGSFAIVFALSFQQQNLHYRRYALAFLNSIFIGILNLLLLKLGPQATVPEMLALIMGGPLGTMFAMWMHDRYFFADSDSAKSMAKAKHLPSI